MTMRITITNDDQTRGAKVDTWDKVVPGTPEAPPPPSSAPDEPAETRTLAPGKSGEFWIHDRRYLVISEV